MTCLPSQPPSVDSVPLNGCIWHTIASPIYPKVRRGCSGFPDSGPGEHLWPGDVIWRQGSRSTLAQVMAWCRNQCWLMISEVLWHSPDSNFTENTWQWQWQWQWQWWQWQWMKIIYWLKIFIIEMSLKFTNLRLWSNPPGANELKWIWVRSQRCGFLVTRFCYQLIAKPGNKTAAPPWPDPYDLLTQYWDWDKINGWHFGDKHFVFIFFNQNCILNQISVMFPPQGPINSIGSYNGLAPNRWQAMICTYDGLVYWSICFWHMRHLAAMSNI